MRGVQTTLLAPPGCLRCCWSRCLLPGCCHLRLCWELRVAWGPAAGRTALLVQGQETSRGEFKRSCDRCKGFLSADPPVKSVPAPLPPACRTPPSPQPPPMGVFTATELFCVNIATWWSIGAMGLITFFLEGTWKHHLL